MKEQLKYSASFSELLVPCLISLGTMLHYNAQDCTVHSHGRESHISELIQENSWKLHESCADYTSHVIKFLFVKTRRKKY
jgi:hypothetical protein